MNSESVVPTSAQSSKANTGRAMCVHCGNEPATRPRGLGWKCFYTPGVRDRYAIARGGEHGAKSHQPEPTAEEVERMVAEQMKCLPADWDELGDG